MLRLGAVSFLNAKPLIEGLRDAGDVHVVFDVPAKLPARLLAGEFDAALIPTIDMLRNAGRLRPVSNACIASDGETMTVRVFSNDPPHRITRLWCDPDSHTSVQLARALWREVYGVELETRPLQPDTWAADADAVLLIGDKVVDPARARFAYEVDLGGAWRSHTGWPFVFAVWATHEDRSADWQADVAHRLERARDLGLDRVADIAAREGPSAGWPIATARRYLERCLMFELTDAAWTGLRRFAACCGLADAIKTAPATDDSAHVRRPHSAAEARQNG